MTRLVFTLCLFFFGLTTTNSTAQTLIKQCQLDGDFEGFDDEKIFEMTDGSVYYQSGYKYSYHYSYMPRCQIFKENGRLLLKVEGMDEMVEVEETKAIKSRIVNDFKGWEGETVFELQNGQIWKQDKYKYKYFYAYRPDAKIVRIDNHFIMTVKGNSIRVRQLK